MKTSTFVSLAAAVLITVSEYAVMGAILGSSSAHDTAAGQRDDASISVATQSLTPAVLAERTD